MPLFIIYFKAHFPVSESGKKSNKTLKALCIGAVGPLFLYFFQGKSVMKMLTLPAVLYSVVLEEMKMQKEKLK